MKITCYGAAQEVTGSKHLLEVNGYRILLDCGLFQGRRKETDKKNHDVSFKPEELDAVILSHAHIDHSGLLPLLTKRKYDGAIYSTPATRDLCDIMLQDSAHIQLRDAQWLAKKKQEYVEPLYSPDDVLDTMKQFISIPYDRRFEVVPGVQFTFYDAGHILGSAMVLLDWQENGRTVRFLYSGDIGRRNLPILRDPDYPEAADVVLMESTYGNREHDDLIHIETQLRDIVQKTYDRGGKIIIPSFALERAQEIVYVLKILEMDDAIPTMPVYVDSPLAVSLTEVFLANTEVFDKEIRKVIEEEGDPFQLKQIHYVRDVQDSMALNTMPDPCIIISASGMCEHGRILHHLKNHATDPKNTILIVGFQAEHTLGRRIVEKQSSIKIFGKMYPLRAEVHIMNAFSCHAGRSELIRFAQHYKKSAREILLVHGEHNAQLSLQDALQTSGLKNISIPKHGITHSIEF